MSSKHLGSSPLTRGKLRCQANTFGPAGLIPAHAGKTRRGPFRLRLRGAHPRSRGENIVLTPRLIVWLGSSPLTRGKLAALPIPASAGGLIPAHAGKTSRADPPTGCSGAHPRSRGENSAWTGPLARGWGSSPLTRGKRAAASEPPAMSGLIPAHAGKTEVLRFLIVSHWAHPRSRGENVVGCATVVVASGSSPLTRGKPACTIRRARRIGLIPAHAGKTSRPTPPRTSTRAHPRSRGENLAGAGGIIAVWGSSPLTRGKPSCSAVSMLSIGLIPAHAGKTSEAEAFCDSSRAHPRSRGENTS